MKKFSIYRATWPVLEKAALIGRSATDGAGRAIAEADGGGVIAWSTVGIQTDAIVGLSPDGSAGYAIVPDAIRGDETLIVGSKRPGRKP